MFFPHLNFPQRCMIAGAIAGVVLELSLTAAFFVSKTLPPGFPRSLLMPLLMGLGGISLLAGVGAFVLAIGAIVKAPSRKRSRRRR